MLLSGGGRRKAAPPIQPVEPNGPKAVTRRAPGGRRVFFPTQKSPARAGTTRARPQYFEVLGVGIRPKAPCTRADGCRTNQVSIAVKETSVWKHSVRIET